MKKSFVFAIRSAFIILLGWALITLSNRITIAEQKIDKFAESIGVVLEHEGGYVNHPKDPGGETNLGVTKKTWEAWGGKKDMKDLTPEDVIPLYKSMFWKRVKGDELPSGLDLVMFDFAVNAGPSRAITKLQIAIGAYPDGKMGPATMHKLADYVEENGIVNLIIVFQSMRQDYYESLDRFDTFGEGWTNRVNSTTEKALQRI